MLRINCILILLLTLFSCKKDKALTAVAGFEVSNIVCYPYDTTSALVKFTMIGGKQPYSISWDNNSFSGEGPHLSVFKKKVTHHITVTDADNEVKTYSYTIDRKKYDSLTYDYRKSIVGTYTGIYSFTQLIMPTPTTYSWQSSYSTHTYEVSKNCPFNSIVINNSTFNYHNRHIRFGIYSFKNDSMFYSQQSSHGNWYSYFSGKKTN